MWFKSFFNQPISMSKSVFLFLAFVFALLEDRWTGWVNQKIDGMIEQHSSIFWQSLSALFPHMHVFIWGLVGFAVLWIIYDAHRQTTHGIYPNHAKKKYLRELKQQADANRKRLGATLNTTASITGKHDIWLLEAVKYIIQGEWGKEGDCFQESEYIDAVYSAIKEINQYVLDGDLPIWGRQKGKFSGSLEEVPKDYWHMHKFNEITFYGAHSAEKCCTERNDQQDQYGRPLDNLKTSKAKVEELWPPRKENVEDKQELIKKLSKLRKDGIALRNASISTETEHNKWTEDFNKWRGDVLEKAYKLSIGLHAILETCGTTEQSPTGLSPPFNGEHERDRRIITTITHRIQKYFEDHP